MTIVIERMSREDLLAEREAIEAKVGDIAAFEARSDRNELNARERELFNLLTSNKHLLGE